MTKPILLLTLMLVSSVIAQNGIETPDGTTIEKPTNITTTFDALVRQETQSEVSSRAIISPVSVDTYVLANYVFYLEKYFNYCERCKRLQYLAFRVGRYYLTARNNFLRLEVRTSNSPANNQLFTAEQQADGTWAFKSRSLNRYIRASNDGSTINFQTFIGAWERWYMERHGDHVHIQSAQFEHHWWIFSSLILKQMDGGASPLIVQYYPNLQWLWNW